VRVARLILFLRVRDERRRDLDRRRLQRREAGLLDLVPVQTTLPRCDNAFGAMPSNGGMRIRSGNKRLGKMERSV
jgi:hypothetical protein